MNQGNEVHENGDHRDSVAGGKRSFQQRVTAVAAESVALLDDLHQDSKGPNAEAIAKARTSIRGGLAELVGEATFPTGPAVARVEQLFTWLLDQLAGLQDLLGEEEEHTSFPALADQVASLYRSWNNMQQLFDVQITIVRKQLGLLIEVVDEVRFAMNAGNLGPADRQIMTVGFNAPGFADAIREQPPMSLENLLDWVHSFASEGGPRAINDGGGFALRSRLAPAAAQLSELVQAATDEGNTAGIQRKRLTPQAEQALRALVGRLDEVAWNC